MVNEACSEEKFISLFNELGSPQAVANALGINVRNVYKRRNNLLKKGIVLQTTNYSRITIEFNQELVRQKMQQRLEATRHSVRRGITMEKGRILVF